MTIVGDSLCSFTFSLCLVCNWGNVLHLSCRSIVVKPHTPPPPPPDILLYIISLSCDSFTGNSVAVVADTLFTGHTNVLIVMLAN